MHCFGSLISFILALSLAVGHPDHYADSTTTEEGAIMSEETSNEFLNNLDTPRATAFMSKGREDLMNSIFENYDKRNYPSNNSIYLAFTLTKIEIYQQFGHIFPEIGGWVDLKWTDPRLAWNPIKFGNETNLIMSEDTIWKPDVATVDSRYDHCQNQEVNVRIEYTGQVQWLRHCTMSPVYKLNFDLSPVQKSAIKFISWTANSDLIDLNVGLPMLVFKPFNFYSKNIKLIDFNIKKTSIQYDGYPAPFVSVDVVLTFQRREKSSSNEFAWSLDTSQESTEIN